MNLHRETTLRVLKIVWRVTQMAFVLGVLCLLVATAVSANYIRRMRDEVSTMTPGGSPLDSLEYAEIKTWRQHAEIYARVPEIQAGAHIDRLRRRLDRLDYERAISGRLSAGFYRDDFTPDGDGTLLVHPRSFLHPRIRQTPQTFLLQFLAGELRAIRAASGDSVEAMYLEPELLDEIYNVDEGLARQLIRLDQVPPHVIHAFLAIEDKDFYSHPGIHARRFAVAMVTNVLYRRLHGASTITQQLARNILLRPDKKIERKVKEWILAVQIEQRYSKDEILERYLNFIDFGRGNNRGLFGIKEATRYFFDKDVEELGIADGALLAAIPNAPTTYSPVANPNNALRRRNLVLRQMLRNGYISDVQYARSIDRPLLRVAPRRRQVSTVATYFTSYVRQVLEQQFTRDDLYARGMRVYTTLDTVFQEEAERAVQTHLEFLDKELGYVPYAAKRRQARAKAGDRFGSADSATELKEYLQAGLVMLETETGYVRALVGGRDFEYNQFNHVTQAKRQAGSSFKPFVYTAAWEQGLTPSFTILDEPWAAGDWTPHNYRLGYAGEVSLEYALQKSLNIPTARLMNDETGVDAVIDVAQRMGIRSPLPPYRSLALGVAEVTPLELTCAYAPWANGGYRIDPIVIQHVVTLDGQVRREAVPRRRRALHPATAAMTTRVLRGVLDAPHGTGRRIRRLGFKQPAAGKTGTTSDYTDAWFLGYTPDYVIGVWVGFDDARVSTKQTGAEGAAPIWAAYAIAILGRTTSDFPAVAVTPPAPLSRQP